MNADPNLIQNIRKELAKYPSVRKAVLFGSRARGDNTERSDYDIAVYGNLQERDKSNLRYFFSEELPTLHKIDLIFMHDQMNQAFISNIEKEGVPIYD